MLKNWTSRILGSLIGTGAIIITILVSTGGMNGINAAPDVNAAFLIPPSLSPVFSEDCKNAWHQYEPLAGMSAYATLNADESNATNSAAWHPNLSIRGHYIVEAFIPNPPFVDSEACFGIGNVNVNSSQVEYVIQHAGGISSVTVNQDSNAGKWVNLGAYTFDPGPADGISLRDLTVETKFTRYVQFSDVRLTPAQPLYMPLIFHQAQSQGPQSIVVRRTRQAFDSCNRPTLGQMQTWWNASPYYIYNLYIGGISNDSCHPELLTASWIKSARDQGWEFIPTWVGPQAPCTSFKYRFSMDKFDAFGEGIIEAKAAMARAVELGLTGQFDPTTVLYYDMEAYGRTNEQCNTAVQYFLSGWSQQLHELGARSGAYGSTTNIRDWQSLSNPLDDVWIASWYYVDHDNDEDTPKVFYYDPNANVWDVLYGSQYATSWTDQQRIRQYSGGHNETWGGLAINIDGNIVDGRVVSPPGFSTPDSPVIQPDELPPPILAEISAQPGISDYQLVLPGQGWVLQNDRLLWTSDGGETWVDRTPGNLFERWLGVHFFDDQTGWALVKDSDQDGGSGWHVLRTEDGGIHWEASGLRVDPGLPTFGETAFIDFVDQQVGWLAIRLRSGSAFSVGLLFTTRDGGITWAQKDIPIGDSIHVVDASTGWTAGGAAGESLFVSRDGGETWEDAAFLSVESGAVFYGLPRFVDPENGIVSVTLSVGHQPRLETYRTHDGGATWHIASVIPLDPDNPPGAMVPAAVLDNRSVFLIDSEADKTVVADLNDSLFKQGALQNLPGDVIELSFADAETGWAKIAQSQCSGTKYPGDSGDFSCQVQESLYQTYDGGQTWTKIR